MVYIIVLLMPFHSVMFMFSILCIVLLLCFHMGAYAHRRLIPLKINQALATGSCMIQGLAVLYKIICLFLVGKAGSSYLTQSGVSAKRQEGACLEEVCQAFSLYEGHEGQKLSMLGDAKEV